MLHFCKIASSMDKVANIYKHKFIILGSDHSNTLGQIRCLGEKGIRPIVIITEKKPYIITKSKYLGECHIVDNIYEGPRFLLDHYSNEEYLPFIYTDRDDIMCAIDDYYDELKGHFIFWNAGGKGRIRQLVNKEKQMEIAIECGLKVIPSELVKRGELPKKLKFPLFTKANNSLNPYWKANAFICRNEKELREAYSCMGIENVLIQHFIDKKDETPIEGISIDGGREVKLLVRKRSMRFAKNGFGVYSEMLPFCDDNLEQKVTDFMRKVCYTGIFEIEFIIDKSNEIFFLEVNFRNTMFNHACSDYGANLLWLFAKWSLSNHIDTSDFKLKQKRHIVMYEFEDLKDSVVHGSVSFLRWLKDFYHVQSFLYIDRHDMRPFLSIVRNKIMKYV